MKIRISEALELYNAKNPSAKLNLGTLADIIIDDRKGRNGKPLSLKQKRWKISGWNNGTGSGKGSCPSHYVAAMSKKLKASSDYLLGLTEEPLPLKEKLKQIF